MLACEGPTEIRMRVSTDVACARVQGLTVTVDNAPGATEARTPQVTHVACRPDGYLGELALVPGADPPNRVVVRVVLGVDRPAEACNRENAYDGCIVVRRRLAYQESTSLALAVHVPAACERVPCDANSTCIEDGRCVESATSCSTTECSLASQATYAP